MNRRGVILPMTLVIVALVTMIAASLLFRCRAEQAASTAGRNGEQARAAAMSGLRRAMSLLTAGTTDAQTWMDNPDQLANQLLIESGSGGWYFTLYAPNDDDGQTLRYGLIDEAAKININVATDETLAALLGDDPMLVDCLMDYLDRDSDPREQGAESDYYAMLQPIPYEPKNGMVLTLEELLLVKGFDASIIYGEDRNWNGRLEETEDDGDGVFDPGLMGVATAVTFEPDVDNDGNPRINLNGDESELEKLSQTDLSGETRRFILLYRAEGNSFAQPTKWMNMTYRLKKNHEEHRGATKGTTIRARASGDELTIVLDKLSTRQPRLGLVNAHTASARVLAALPGIDDELAQRIVDERETLDGADKTTIAWLHTNGVVETASFQMLAAILTARSFQYRARSVGFHSVTGQFCVLEAIISLDAGSPRMFYVRDLTRAGLPVSIDTDAIEGFTTR